MIPCIAYILNYLKQCYYSNYAFGKISNNNYDSSTLSSLNFTEPTSTTKKGSTHKLLYRYNAYFSDKFVSKLLIIYLTLVIIYSLIIGFISKNYSLFPLEKGFCVLT